VVVLSGSGRGLLGLLYYFTAYLAANVGAFALVASTGRFEIPDNRALIRSEPLLTLAMLVSLLSLVASRRPPASSASSPCSSRPCRPGSLG
jgi:NADH:ubiquinone oxidoreductase subunit 2 (subunit N)